jgi:hypothetical protein
MLTEETIHTNTVKHPIQEDSIKIIDKGPAMYLCPPRIVYISTIGVLTNPISVF